jgi:hypothetical protein
MGRRMNSGQHVVRDYKMPESFKAFCNMVSLTAAKTSRMFDVSVACVRLAILAMRELCMMLCVCVLLWVQVKVCTVDLIKPPQ